MPRESKTNLPLRANVYGFALCFVPQGHAYGAPAARAVMAGLRAMNFSGRCEYYTRESLTGDEYIVLIGLRHAAGKPRDEYGWWESFAESVSAACKAAGEIRLHGQRGELAEVGQMRRDSISCGAIEFSNGIPATVLDDLDSWFTSECQETLQRYATTAGKL